MALTVYQNLYALTSQRYLASNQTALGKSIERLSSGLRINHASDDASGLAISEKMRGQISGMKRAKMNAQDGISYLQTAEGAMEQTSNILQRMRELAVQAANGIYTTNDRLELQKEIDQLKAEIDRISTSTEFNTRKLINGDGTALWSSDSKYISAIVRSPVTEGNYEIAMSVRPGRNEIYKTHIYTLQEGRIAAEITTAAGTPNDTNVGSVSNPVSLSPTSGNPLEFAIGNSPISPAATIPPSSTILSEFKQKDSAWTATMPATGSTYSAVETNGRSGYFEIEFLEDVTTSVLGADFRVRFYDAKTGEVGAWNSYTNAGGNTAHITFQYSDPSSGIPTISAAYSITIGTGMIHKGDKLLTAVSASVPATSANETLAKVGGGTIQVSQDGVGGPLLVYSSSSSLTKVDNGDNILDVNAVIIHIAEMDNKTGNINFGNITLNFKEQPDTRTAPGTNVTTPLGQLGTTDIGNFQVAVVGGGEAATTTTRLKDIAQFIDADGNNVFENKQELTIYGNGKQTVVHIEGNDTIATLVEKMTKAIVEDLDMGSEDSQVNANLVRYITVADPTGWGTIKGTMLIQTALTGEQSRLSFIGDQTLINALGIATVQQYENNETTVTIRDAHTGNLIGTEVTGDDRIYTLINGIDLVLDSRAGVLSTWNPATNSIVFEGNPDLATQRFHLHLVDNRTSLQIGANKGQHLNVSIPQLDLVGLGIENVTLVSQDRAREALGKIDRALTMVVSARATVGAQVSRLEHTIENLATATEYLIASESRIRDLDVAEESTIYAKNQILVQSGIAMLAQANQLPQMALTLISGG